MKVSGVQQRSDLAVKGKGPDSARSQERKVMHLECELRRLYALAAGCLTLVPCSPPYPGRAASANSHIETDQPMSLAT